MRRPLRASYLAASAALVAVLAAGQPHTAPYSTVGVAGMNRTIGAVTPQSAGEQSYAFRSWSDGEPATHDILSAKFDTTYTAAFDLQDTPRGAIIADTTIQRGKTGLGAKTTLEADGKPDRDFLVKLVVSGTDGRQISGVNLRLFATNGSKSSKGPTFHQALINEWSESVRWEDAPGYQTTPIASLGKLRANRWYEVNLASLIKGDGTYSLRASLRSSDGVAFASREAGAARAPQLIVTLSPLPTSAAAPPTIVLGTPEPPGGPSALIAGFNHPTMTVPFPYTEPRGKEATTSLRPMLLRFPGGTSANFYDWQADRFFGDASGHVPKVTDWNRNLDANRGGRYGLEDFFSLAREVGAEPMLVVNLYWPLALSDEQMAQRAADWVREVNIVQKRSVKYWELGNEYYLRSESACSKCYADRYPNAAAYVSAARRAAEAMRAVDPSIYIIVLLQGPLSFRRADSRDDSKANAWADAVAFASPRFFDGVSTHTYIFTSGGELTSEAGWLFSASQAQPVRLKDWLQAKFGPGVQNWQTETGVPFNSSPAVQLTVLEALVDADVILQNAKFADVHRNLSRHALNLGSEGTWQYCGGDDLFKTVSYHVYSKLNEVLGRATRAIPTELSDVPTFSGTHQYSNVQVPVITAGAWKAADGSIDLALVNKDGRPLTLKLAGEGVVPNGDATTYTVSGPIGAKNTCSAPSEVTPLTNTVSITGSNPTITVPAYSFTVLTIKPS